MTIDRRLLSTLRRQWDEGRCACLACGAADGCEGPGTEYIADDAAGITVCPGCARLHPQAALEAYVAATT